MSLRSLDLSDNPRLASASASTWHPLLRLRLLHTLDLSRCGIHSPPAVLAPLRAAGLEVKVGPGSPYRATGWELHADMGGLQLAY